MDEDVRSARVYVAECLGEDIKVVCDAPAWAAILAASSFVFLPACSDGSCPGHYYVKRIASEPEKGRELMRLRDAGIPMGGGKEWNPQEVFEDLREKGLVKGPYLAIGWIGPGHHILAER